MKCLKCGKELEDSMLLCPQCGTKVMTEGENNADTETGVPQNDSTGSTGPATPRGKQKKAHKGLFALIVAVVMLAVLLVSLLVVLKSVKAKKVNEQVDAIKKAKIGDTVKFGSYEQDNNLINGAEAIEWIVLDKKDGKYLLLSKYCLDAKPYNTELEQVTWETCTLRNWLNNDFYTTAFSQKERGYIATTTVRNADNPKYGTEGGNDTKDKVFLLSIEEATTYFSSDLYGYDPARRAQVTEYAKAQWACYSEEDEYYGNGCWWLRSPGNLNFYAAVVITFGGVDGFGIDVGNYNDSVRPALWIEP